MPKLQAGRPSAAAPQKTLTDLKAESKTRLNADIPKTLYKQVKQRALDEDTTVTEVVKRALNEYLSK